MKIVGIDNYDRETVDDVLVCEHVHDGYAQKLIEFLNAQCHEAQARFFRLVPDDYPLRRWEP